MRARVLDQLAGAIATAGAERVAVDGVDAAGKTTLADELVPPLEARELSVARVSIDDFLRPREERYRRGEESPEGYYLDSFDHDTFRTAVLAATTDVVLCDGIFLQRPELDDLWDFRVFVAVTWETMLSRAAIRDAALFGGAHATRLRYERRIVPAQRRYLAERNPRTRADAVLKNDDPTVPRLVLQRRREST